MCLNWSSCWCDYHCLSDMQKQTLYDFRLAVDNGWCWCWGCQDPGRRACTIILGIYMSVPLGWAKRQYKLTTDSKPAAGREQPTVSVDSAYSTSFNALLGWHWRTVYHQSKIYSYLPLLSLDDRLCGLVVRVSGYRYRGPGFDSWHWVVVGLERGLLSLMSLLRSIEELLE